MRVGKQESPAYLATLQVVPGILSHLNDCGAGLGRLAAGSIPYMREKRVFSTIATDSVRFNPTCVGKTVGDS